MEKENARKQTLEQLHERRKQVVRLHKKAIGIMQIVEMTGLSYPAVRACIDLFDAGGWNAIRPALRGRSPGTGRTLAQEQEDSIQRIIIDNRPGGDSIIAIQAVLAALKQEVLACSKATAKGGA